MREAATDGLLLVDKPAGVTSHDVVLAARRAFGESRIGHAGTLDPFATGLLVLLLGRATRLLPHLDGVPKEYMPSPRKSPWPPTMPRRTRNARTWSST